MHSSTTASRDNKPWRTRNRKSTTSFRRSWLWNHWLKKREGLTKPYWLIGRSPLPLGILILICIMPPRSMRREIGKSKKSNTTSKKTNANSSQTSQKLFQRLNQIKKAFSKSKDWTSKWPDSPKPGRKLPLKRRWPREVTSVPLMASKEPEKTTTEANRSVH